MSHAYSLLQVDKLLCVRAKRDWYHRKPNGLLLYPPEIYVPFYNEKQAYHAYEPISWEAAHVLSQSAMIEIESWLHKQRNAE